MILWVFWLLVGFPQITGESFFPQIIPMNFTPEKTYLLNRATKLAMFFAYLTLFPRLEGPKSENSEIFAEHLTGA